MIIIIITTIYISAFISAISSKDILIDLTKSTKP